MSSITPRCIETIPSFSCSLCMISVTKPQWVAAASVVIVFIIDVFTPVNYTVYMLYICSIVIVFKQSKQTILFFCVMSCLLVLVSTDYFMLVFKHTIALWINRSICVVGICITSYIAI